MDPASLTFGLVGLLPLVTKAITITRDYWKNVRSAKEKVSALLTELEALRNNLHALQEMLDSHALETENIACDGSSVLTSCSTACRAKLQILNQKLSRPRSRLHAFKWPLEEKEHNETLSEIRQLTMWMQFSLSMSGYQLLSRSSSEVLETLSDHLSRLNEMKEDHVEIRRGLEQQQSSSQKTAEARTRLDILNWLSALNVQPQHDKVRASRTGNTGSWLLQNEDFVRWRDEDIGHHPNVLWCHGIPGSGKTVLSSLVIDELLRTSSPSSPVAYFYFDYREANSQRPQAVLRCLLRQIAAKLHFIPEGMMDLWLAEDDTGSWALQKCKQMMSMCLAETERTYFVLDGLDECNVSKHRQALLDVLLDMAQLPQTRLFVTSRPHIHEIMRTFRNYPQVEIRAHAEDLHSYIRAELDDCRDIDFLDEHLTTRILHKITNNANGMFLLPVLQLRAVLNEPTPGELEDALDSLSGNLSEAFEETIARIQKLPKSRAQLGMSTLMWLCHSKRRLNTAELSDVLAFEKCQNSKLVKYRPTMNMILECCQGLVVVGTDGDHVELAHYSIQEYLASNSERLFPRWEASMTSVCLKYLMLEEFRSGPRAISNLEKVEAAISCFQRHSKYDYFSDGLKKKAEWCLHEPCRYANLADPKDMKKLLHIHGLDPTFPAPAWKDNDCEWPTGNKTDVHLEHEDSNTEDLFFGRLVTPLLDKAKLEFLEKARRVTFVPTEIDKERQHTSLIPSVSQTEQQQPDLGSAALTKPVSDSFAQDSQGASAQDNVHTSKALSMTPEYVCDCELEPQNSIRYDFVKARIRNFPFSSYAAAFWHRHGNCIKVLDPHEPDLFNFINDNKAVASSLQIRRFQGGYRSMYVDPFENLSHSPLHTASQFGLEKLLVTLLDGPDASSMINSRTTIVGTTPVILAASCGYSRLVKLLLQRGADPYITNWYGNALHCAAESNKAEVVTQLIHFGMDPNSCGECGEDRERRTPVQCTLDRDSVASLQTLVSLGASVDTVDEHSQAPFLHQAAADDAYRIVEYLLRGKLADFHSQSPEGLTALDIAIASSATETICTLLLLDPAQSIKDIQSARLVACELVKKRIESGYTLK